MRLFELRILKTIQLKNGLVDKRELGRGRMWRHPTKERNNLTA